jgi:enoyl-[acyl-carrier-protein] reductase (NADH)
MANEKNNLLFQLEQEIAKLLLAKLEHFEISLERASQIAKFILAHLPDNLTDEQVAQIIPSLDDEFSELAGIVHKHMLDYEEKYKNEVVNNVQDLIKHQHFQQASSQISDYFNRKLKVE